MKAVLKETKRIMAVLLSVAMIFAYVPETVFTYGANVTDEAVEQMSEETSEQASEQNEEPSSEAPSEEPTTEAPAEEIEEEPIAEKAGDGAEDVIEDGEAITDEKEDAVLRGMTLDGDPSSLDDLKYGDEPGNVTITAKQTVSGTTTTYTGATLKLYKLNTDAYTWGTSSTAAAALTAAQTAFTNYNNTRAAYIGANMAEGTEKTNYEAATAVIETTNAEFISEVSSGSSILNGLGVTIANGVVTFKTDSFIKETHDSWYVVKYSDDDPEKSAANLPLYSTPFEIKAQGVWDGNVATVTPDASDAGKTVGTNVAADNGVHLKNFATTEDFAIGNLPDVKFNNANQNFTVYKTLEAAKAAKGSSEDGTSADVVVAEKIAITAAGLSSTKPLKNVAWAITNKDGTANTDFEVIEAEVDDDGLFNNGPINLYVAPKSTLTSQGTSKTYTAYLHIYHSNAWAIADEYIARLNITVGNDLALTVADGELPEVSIKDDTLGLLDDDVAGDNKKAYASAQSGADYAAGGKYNPYVIATKHIGEEIKGVDSVVFKTSGGSGNITWTVDSVGATNISKDGLRTDFSTKVNPGTLTVTGTLKQDAFVDFETATTGLLAKALADPTNTSGDVTAMRNAITAHEFKVTATDAGNSTVEKYFIIESLPVDAEDITIRVKDDIYLDYGATTTKNVYNWTAPSDTKEEKVGEFTKTIQIHNGTNTKLTYSYTNTTALTSNGFNASPANKLEIEAGATGELVLTPLARTDSNAWKSALAFTGTGMSNTGIEANFNISTNDLDITTPRANNFILPEGMLGVIYEKDGAPSTGGFEFKYVAPETTNFTGWSITDIKEGVTFNDSDGDGIANTVTGGSTLTPVSKLTSDYGLTFAGGVLYGTPKKLGTLQLTVKADYVGAGGSAPTRIVLLEIGKPDVDTGILVTETNTSTNVSATKKVNMGSVDMDATTGAKAEFSILNQTAVEMTGVRATLNADLVSFTDAKGVKSYPTGTAADYFKVVYDENDPVKDQNLTTSGLSIKKETTGNFKLVSKPSPSMAAGTYVASVTVSSTASLEDSLTFTATLVVADKPILNVENMGTLGADGKYADGTNLKVGVDTSGNEAFAVNYATNSDLTWEYAVEVDGRDITLGTQDKISGLTFTQDLTSKKLNVRGTYAKAGDMVVNVTATSGTLSTSKTFTFAIAGTQTVTVTVDGSANVEGKVYVLKSNQVGDTPVPSTISIKNMDAAAAENLDITVEKAPDDRIMADRIKKPGNPYEGSVDAIGITKPSPSVSIGAKDSANDTATAVITPNTTKAGEFKVKVTVTGKAVKPVTFYVYSTVFEPLTLVAPSNPVAEVGVKTHYEIIAQNADKNVTFTEVKGLTETTKDVAETDTKKQIVAGIGFEAASTVNATQVLDADYGGTTEHIHELVISDSAPVTSAVLDKDNKVKGFEISEYNDGAPKNAGTYTVNLRGVIAQDNFDVTKHYSDGINQDAAANYLNVTNAIAERKAWTSFTLTVNKSTAVKVKNVTSGTKETATKYDIDTGWGADTSRSGIVANEVKSYTVKPAAKVSSGGNYNSSAVHVGIYNGSSEDITVTLTRNNADFTIATGTLGSFEDSTLNKNGTVNGTGVTGDPYKVTLTAGKTSYVKVTPASTLDIGPHACVITVAGASMSGTKTLTMNFEVQAVNALIDVDYVSEAIDKYATSNPTSPPTNLAQNISYKYFINSRYYKPTEIAKANVSTSKVVELTPFKEGATSEVHDVLFVRNTGNSVIGDSKVRVEEVLNAAGDEITSSNDYKLVTATGDNATSATTGAKLLGSLALPTYDAEGELNTCSDLWVAVKPNGDKDLAAGADYNAFLKFTVDGDNPVSFVVPVHFVVYSKSVSTVSHTPASNAITMETKEFYDPKQVTGGEIVITNNGTDGDKTNLHKLNITLSNSTDFYVISDDEENIVPTASGYQIKEIKSGKSASFKVVPVPGRKNGDYTTTVTVTGGNLATSVKINKNVSLTINKSTDFSTNVYTTIGAPLDADIAQRLYTSLKQVSGLASIKEGLGSTTAIAGNATFTGVANSTTPDITGDNTAGKHHVDVYLDLDNNNYADTLVQFVADETIDEASKVDGAYVVRRDATGSDVELAKYSYDMTISAPSGTDKYFSKLTFNENSFVTLELTEDKWIVNEDYDTFEEKNENVWNAGKKVTLAGDYKGKITGANGTDKAFFVTVKNGSSAGSVFTAKKLPTPVYVDGSRSSDGWQVKGGLGKITDSTAVRRDMIYEPSYHVHEYPADADGDAADGSIKWTWNADHSQAQVVVKCISTDPTCPDANKGAITLTSQKGQITITPSEEKADCTQGTRKQFKAQTVASAMPNGAVYTSTVALDEDKSTILGHDYKTTISWVEKSDGSWGPVITQVCTRSGCADKDHKKSYTVPASSIVVTENVKKAPTCLETGETVYTITSFVDGNGKTVSGDALAAIQDYTYTATIKAKGHDYKLVVEWNADHLTAKTANLVCQVCATDTVGHKVDVLSLVKVEPKTNEVTGEVISNTATVVYDGKTYTDRWDNDVLYDPQISIGQWPATYKKGDTFVGMSWSGTVKSKNNNGATQPIEGKVTISPEKLDAADASTEFEFTATADLSDYYADVNKTAKAANKVMTGTYRFDASGLGTYVPDHDNHTWKFNNNFVWSPDAPSATTAPSVTASYTCQVGQEVKAATVTVTSNEVGKDAKAIVRWAAKAVDPDGKNPATDYRYVWKSTGAAATKADYDKVAGGNYDDDAEEDGVFTVEFPNGDEYTYTGAQIKPEVLVTNGEKTLIKDTDYTVSYANNTNAGTATAKVKGKGNYSSTIMEASFTIKKADIAEAAFGNLAYKTGTTSDKIKPSANYKGKTLKLGTDFTLGAFGEIDSSTGLQTLEIKGAGNNFDSDSSKTVTLKYSKSPQSIKVTFSFPKDGFPYTGEPVDAEEIAKCISVTNLIEGTEPQISYVADPTDAGTYKVAVTADGLKGSKTGTFKIAPAKAATMTVTNKEALETDGTAFKVVGATPYVAVSAKIDDSHEYDLVPGRDYKVTYSNNKKAGTGKYTIKFQGNYNGAPNSSFKNLPFKINKANSSDAKIYVADMIKGSNEKSKQYFATADKNMFVAVDEGKMQIKKSDYTVAFSQGDKALTGKGTETIEFTEGVAELTVTVTPKGVNFEGDPITETYKVIDAGSNVAVNKATSKLVAKGGTKVTKPGYTGAVITFEQSDDNRQGDIVINGGKIGGAKANLTAAEVAEYFDVTYVNNVQKGKAYYILTAKDGNDKNYVGSIVGNFTIKAGDIKKSAE